LLSPYKTIEVVGGDVEERRGVGLERRRKIDLERRKLNDIDEVGGERLKVEHRLADIAAKGHALDLAFLADVLAEPAELAFEALGWIR